MPLPHGLDEDLQFLTLADRRELETLLIAHTVDLSDVGGVDEHLGKVVTVVEGEHRGSRNLREGGQIENGAPALIEFLHGLEG